MKEQGKRMPLEERNLPPETIKKLLQMLSEKLLADKQLNPPTTPNKPK